jgi:hypothetical protein
MDSGADAVGRAVSPDIQLDLAGTSGPVDVAFSIAHDCERQAPDHVKSYDDLATRRVESGPSVFRNRMTSSEKLATHA